MHLPFTTSEALLEALRAAAEPTRLRLLDLCASAELTVSELTQILGQSQPRVSRHLKLLCDAGLLVRLREGSWAFYRLARDGSPAAALAASITAAIPATDPDRALDRARLADVRQGRSDLAARYFRDNAGQWDQIRAMHVDEAEVERALLAALGPCAGLRLLDIGTGTGRVLELTGPALHAGVGIDQSREMLAIARLALDRAGLANCSVRQGDLLQLPFPAGSFERVAIHQVLHFIDDPAAAVREAARVLAPGGRLVMVDFAPHALEDLRERHAHRRLGFADTEVAGWAQTAGLIPRPPVHLPGARLTVAVWAADAPVRS